MKNKAFIIIFNKWYFLIIGLLILIVYGYNTAIDNELVQKPSDNSTLYGIYEEDVNEAKIKKKYY